jgi:hypothetical protein
MSRLLSHCFSCFDEESESAYPYLVAREQSGAKDLLPAPAVDSTPISPPCSSVSSLEMNKPRPDPPY